MTAEYHPLKKFRLPKKYEWNKNISNVAYNPWTDLRKRDDVRKLNLTFPWQKIPSKKLLKFLQDE